MFELLYSAGCVYAGGDGFLYVQIVKTTGYQLVYILLSNVMGKRPITTYF